MNSYDGSLSLIDRRKNLFKLAQGEYIAPEKIENFYVMVNGVAEAFVYGEPLKFFLVAIIVPNQDYIMNYAEKEKIEGSFEELCKNELINKHILNNLEEFGKSHGLNSLERVKKIKLEAQSFIVKGACTPSFKMRRFEAKNIFAKELKELYQE